MRGAGAVISWRSWPAMNSHSAAMGRAIGGRKRALLGLLLFGPFGMASLAIEVGESGVDAMQAGELFQCLAVEEECAAKLAALHSRIGDQRGHVRRLGAGLPQLFEGGAGERLIAHPEAVPGDEDRPGRRR